MTVIEDQQDLRLPVGLLIGGEWVHNTSAGEMVHYNPTTGRAQRAFPVAGPPEVDLAVKAARRAQETLRSWTPVDRRDLMLRIASACEDRAAEFASIATLECGMVQGTAAGMAASLSRWFKYYAGWADKLEGSVVPAVPGFNYSVPEPFGVVAVILTWNGPIASIGMKVAAAVAAGCSVVLKPPELAPFGANLFALLCIEAGMPSGMLNVVPGGPEAGQALVRHPGIDKISFTGGPATARTIQADAAQSLTPLLLELGGKSANLVFDDADLELAAASAAIGITRLAGQFCVAPSRLLVQAGVYDAMVERVAHLMRSMPVGDPSDPSSEMGPLISQAAIERVVDIVHRAESNGEGTLVAGGRRLDGDLGAGYFIGPTAFADVDNSSTIAQQEIFGPVLSIIQFSSDEEGLRMANDTEYGLAAYLHTRDVSRAHRVASRLDAGNVSVNGAAAQNAPYAPFGGFKDSGYGKEGGLQGILEYTRTKNVCINI